MCKLKNETVKKIKYIFFCVKIFRVEIRAVTRLKLTKHQLRVAKSK